MLKAGVTHLICLAPLIAQAPGLRLIAPLQGNQTQLVDGNGVTVHAWAGINNVVVHLDENGDLIRGVQEPNNSFPGTTGRLQRLDIHSNVKWDMLVSDNDRYMHHDICPLPNGNVLVMTVDRMTRAEAIAAGRDPALLSAPDWLPETIVEIQQTGPTTGDVVWQWRVMDHIVQDFDPQAPGYGVVADHPELVDINYPPVDLDVIGDWNHANGIDYDPVNDWIIISSRDQDECWLIDHSTTTAEAAGHTGGARGRGGDLLWRWGNPECYGRGTPAERVLFRQHDPRFIPPGFPGAGNITIFNNQVVANHPTLPNQSSVIEITMPLDAQGNPFVDPATSVYGPAAPVWTYAEPGFYSAFVSSAQRLRNGNTLICSGQSSLMFEVTPTKQTVWSYTYPSGAIIFQAESVERRLWAGSREISVSNGGLVPFTHITDTQHAGDCYFLLGSLSGTTPGVPLPGGLTLPLNVDELLLGMVAFPNISVFENTLGLIDSAGNASSKINIPPGLLLPVLIGGQMDLCYVVIDTDTGLVTKVSNVESVTLNP